VVSTTKCAACKSPCILSKVDGGKLLSQLRMLNMICYEKGESIFEQGEPVSGCYIICCGQVKEGWRTSLGERRTLRILGQGRLLAVTEALSRQSWHDTYAIAIEDEESRLLFIAGQEFYTLLKHPTFSVELVMGQEIVTRAQDPVSRNPI